MDEQFNKEKRRQTNRNMPQKFGILLCYLAVVLQKQVIKDKK